MNDFRGWVEETNTRSAVALWCLMVVGIIGLTAINGNITKNETDTHHQLAAAKQQRDQAERAASWLLSELQNRDDREH